MTFCTANAWSRTAIRCRASRRHLMRHAILAGRRARDPILAGRRARNPIRAARRARNPITARRGTHRAIRERRLSGRAASGVLTPAPAWSVLRSREKIGSEMA